MFKILPVTEREGSNIKTTIITLDIDEGIDVKEAVKAACTEYCQTEDGKLILEGNGNVFNWGDLTTYVPNSICGKHGFRIIDLFVHEDEIDFNEQLVDESDIFSEEE